MKKRAKALILILIITGAVVTLLICFNHPKTTDLSIANRIVITDNYANGGSKSIEITKETDKISFEKIMNLCSKNLTAITYETPACMFERYKIEFTDGNKSIIVIPSDDECNTILVKTGNKDFYYYIPEQSKTELIGILKGVSVTYRD